MLLRIVVTSHMRRHDLTITKQMRKLMDFVYGNDNTCGVRIVNVTLDITYCDY